jgi:hypothetical protein
VCIVSMCILLIVVIVWSIVVAVSLIIGVFVSSIVLASYVYPFLWVCQRIKVVASGRFDAHLGFYKWVFVDHIPWLICVWVEQI